MGEKKVKVLIVDDSALIRSILETIIPFNSDVLEVIGFAGNGEEAVLKNRELQPDLITMDIDMPVMNGIEAVKQIMQDRPVPIIVLSGNVNDKNSFQALRNGALEVMEKPEILDFNNPEVYIPFQQKLVSIAGVKVRAKGKAGRAASFRKIDAARTQCRMIVLGVSTGGPAAVAEVLTRLPADFPVGIAMVQHIEEGFGDGYAKWLDSLCMLKVRSAKGIDSVSPGEIVIAPDDRHIIFEKEELLINDGKEVLHQKPSVDVLFNSAAGAFGRNLIGVLLTGMGTDGAEGCRKIIDSGGYTIVQDEATSVVFGMPNAAIELGAASIVLPLPEIHKALIKLTGGRKDDRS